MELDEVVHIGVRRAAGFAQLPDAESQARAYGAKAVLRDIVMVRDASSAEAAMEWVEALVKVATDYTGDIR